MNSFFTHFERCCRDCFFVRLQAVDRHFKLPHASSKPVRSSTIMEDSTHKTLRFALRATLKTAIYRITTTFGDHLKYDLSLSTMKGYKNFLIILFVLFCLLELFRCLQSTRKDCSSFWSIRNNAQELLIPVWLLCVHIYVNKTVKLKCLLLISPQSLHAAGRKTCCWTETGWESVPAAFNRR